MKGFTKVSRDSIRAACIFWEVKYERGEELVKEGAKRYHYKHFTQGSVLTKLLNKNKTPFEFTSGRMGFLTTWNEHLKGLMTKQEAALIDIWQWDRGLAQFKACKALLDASTNTPLLGNELCAWVNKHKTWIEEEHNV